MEWDSGSAGRVDSCCGPAGRPAVRWPVCLKACRPGDWQQVQAVHQLTSCRMAWLTLCPLIPLPQTATNWHLVVSAGGWWGPLLYTPVPYTVLHRNVFVALTVTSEELRISTRKRVLVPTFTARSVRRLRNTGASDPTPSTLISMARRASPAEFFAVSV